MTSTVLDVTVLLLCVSASVVALAGDGGNVGTAGPTADDVADRLATETVTVTYEAPEAPGGTRSVHATRTELLAILVDAEERNASSDPGRHTAFGPSARSAIAEGLEPRVRIDARGVESTAAVVGGETTDQLILESLGETDSDGTPWSADGIRKTEWSGTAAGTSWGVTEPDELTADGASVKREETIRGEVVIGTSPPRNADATTAVIEHPAPSGTDSIESVRIVVRRW